jgi:HD-like signal output (HDOD) protein
MTPSTPSEPVTLPTTERLIARLPAFSPIALRLMAIIFDEDVSFKEVARMISLDPAISGQVLKLANSGFYGRRSSVHSILHAIALVGIKTLSGIVVTAAIWKALPRRGSPFMTDWWRHSVASALIAAYDAKANPNLDSAYTASLLHGIGQLALSQHAPAEYNEAFTAACSTGRDLLEFERGAFGIDHAELAGRILERWKLPQVIQEAVALHHSAASPSKLGSAVQTGCIAAEYIGFGKCGCHNLIAAGELPPGVVSLIESKDFLEGLPQQVNGIECSLL